MAFLNGGCNNGSCNLSLARHICEFIGETVTIFTTSGGASGCGFTGVVLSVNACFVRLITEQGTAPSNPLAENICGDFDSKGRGGGYDAMGSVGMGGHRRDDHRRFGSVCDIPIENIAAFCHNAV
ncbi:MAG: hypothetical protein EWM47_12870 [Anaerolineaceae bacterium]|nr:MAG: hypothetical protein EWM47_12870 [Anaerolineaceae bacterium]